VGIVFGFGFEDLGRGVMTKLRDLEIGSRGRVTSVDTSNDIGVRLLEMGVTPGAELTLLGKAPWGDPLEYEVRGYRLSLRRTEAARVQIELLT
jgi:Fe2+ transport system protein FeoA